jgi:DNA-binding Xre family transcriptional regulator
MQRLLAVRGMVISAGKMSGLWSGQPNTVRLEELDVICAVLGCGVEELLIPEPEKTAAPRSNQGTAAPAIGEAKPVVPRSYSGRSLPPR